MSIEEPELHYYQLDDEIGYTPQDIPEGSTEITYDTYLTLVAAIQSDADAAREAALLESS